MKRSTFVCLFMALSVVLSAQVSKTVDCTAGALSSLLTAEEKSTVTDLTITGVIDARDFKTMRDSMGVLEDIDLSEVFIDSYAEIYESGNNYIFNENSIPRYAFTSFQKLKIIYLPTSLETIGESSFSNCKNLIYINIPSNVTSIGMRAFNLCEKLTSLIIPSSVNWIGEYAFAGCEKLNSIDLPNSITKLNEYTSVANLSKGMYLLRIKTDDGEVTKKMIKE